jgi:hypothetical protein
MIEDLRCSFCNKSQKDVKKLIADPHVLICDECIDACNDVIAADIVKASTEGLSTVPSILPTPVSGPPIVCVVCGQPTPPSDVVPIQQRGVICIGCIGCIGEIEAAVAERRSES